MAGIWQITNVAMRALAFLWSLLVMALIGNMIDDWNHGNNGVINYDLFVSVFGMASLLYLIPATLKDAWAIHPIFPLVLDVLNVIFWFCGGVATAAKLHVHSCDNHAYLIDNSITRGSTARCREAQASTAFLWFGFASFLVSSVISGIQSRSGTTVRPGIRRGPVMSQV